MKLSFEEREALESIFDSEGWPTLLKAIEILANDQLNRVVSYNLAEGPEGLVIAKARFEGASQLRTRISELKSKIRKQDQ